MNSDYFKKIFRWQQESGWCGPAVIQMALAAGKIRKSQKEIAKDVYMSWWGTNHEAMYSYLARYYKTIDFKEDAQISDIDFHLKRGHTVIANWWDNIDPEDEEGHYSLILSHDKKRKRLTLADPSAARGIWDIEEDKFISLWYDYLDLRKVKRIKRWILWLDPKSRI